MENFAFFFEKVQDFANLSLQARPCKETDKRTKAIVKLADQIPGLYVSLKTRLGDSARMTTTISHKNKNEMDRGVVNVISQSINWMLKKQKTVVFGIVGGRSVSGIFRRLKATDISWKKTHIFMIDERLVPLDSPQSNFRLAKEKFINELLINKRLPPENVHPFVMDISKPDFGISNYEDTLQCYGNIYDIILLIDDSYVLTNLR